VDEAYLLEYGRDQGTRPFCFVKEARRIRSPMGPQPKSTPARGIRAQTPGATESISLDFSAPASSSDFAEKRRNTHRKDNETETKDSGRRELVRSPSYMSVRAQGFISDAHHRPWLWNWIRYATSCSLPLSKRREQLKRTTGEPQHDISRDACGLNRAA
jgi:hypothetical protein